MANNQAAAADVMRVNIRVSPEVHQYYKERAYKTGVSMSSLMFLDLERAAKEHSLSDLMMQRRMERHGDSDSGL